MGKKQVLLQEWMTERGFQRSISKDKAQLDATIARLKEEGAEPEGDTYSVEIPDKHGLVGMVAGDTVFLTEDEYVEAVTFPDEE